MPLALLLSPDDQAVSAITAVLEEMLVTWERPLDGVSAAQKLNSHSFDLVLVDCENLPAAKLIFDVCRRGKSGNNPVPIAIVDGRAGLPTAFRLGAELILTKPVAKDQARTTIRTAVSRVKKDEPVHTALAANDLNAPQNEALQLATDHANHGTSFAFAPEAMAEEHALAAAATPSQLMSYSDPVPAATSSAPALAMTMSATAVAPEIQAPVVPEVPPVLADSKRSIQPTPAASPAPVESVKTEARVEVKPFFGSEPPAQKESSPTEASPKKKSEGTQGRKTSGSLIAVLVLMLVGAGLYAAWMYEPGFKTLAQPQVDRVLALVGTARPQQPQSHTPAPVKPAVEPASVPVPATSADSIPAGQTAAADASTAATTSPTPSSSPTNSTPTPASPTPSATTPAAGAASTSPAIAKPAPAKVDVAKVDSSTKADVSSKSSNLTPNPVNAAAAKNVASTTLPEAELPGEKNAIILSSKGAEKRLIHSVQPTYPSGVKPAEVQGTLVLKTVVDENGKVTGARVIEGNAALASAAISTVKQWRYRPYVRDGKSLPFQTIVLLDFQRP